MKPELAALIARAIVHLNFGEPEKAEQVLFEALTEINFPANATEKGFHHGNAAA